ncbi:MAG: flagellar basal body-associated FliL family protein [Desulfobacterales bacterium]|nr:MAG: flagellar basal body-associated FliL family protein [Desulfobacterales bacterium]
MSTKILVSLVAILFVVMLGLTAGLFMIWTKLSTADAVAKEAAAAKNPQAVTQSLGTIFSLDTFIVNLADESGKRYLRITMDLELSNDKLVEEMKRRLPQMRDGILMILPTKRFEDIRTVEGKTRLRNEIIAKLNSLLGHGSITNIFFTEFVVQ